jgi:tRNA pseudouridine38-40 synthase
MTPSFVAPAAPSLARTTRLGPGRSPICCADASGGGGDGGEGRVRFRARVAYDGTRYCGWQFQPRLPTVQGTVEAVLSRKMGGRLVRVVGASRTDSGVHARGQMAHFDVPAAAAAVQLGDEALVRQFEFTMNRMLPDDVWVYDVERAPLVVKCKRGSEGDAAPAMFNAIYDSRAKLYSYRFSVARTPDPLERLMRLHDWRGAAAGFDAERAQAAADVFVGTHDFTAFANAGPKVRDGAQPAAVVTNPVRTVRSVTVVDEGSGGAGRFRVDFLLEGALFRMVRNMMGAILGAGAGAVEPERVAEVLASRRRDLAPRGAEACGLCLEHVFYDPALELPTLEPR